LVDRGANFDKASGQGAHVMIFKSATKEKPSVDLEAIAKRFAGDGDGLCTYMKSHPEAYQAYRRLAFKPV
jgi:hypothetical protein